MTDEKTPPPLHGVTLKQIVTTLAAHYGWERLARRIHINCFKNDPSVKSSLTFLRKNDWARKKVEALYIDTFATQDPWGKARNMSKCLDNFTSKG